MPKLSDFTQDAKNANKGTKRGADAVAESLRRYGAGRSILVDRAGRVIAGNKSIAAAQAAGLDDTCIVVESDGSKLVVVRRTDLDLERDATAKGLAIADNRTADLGLEWDPANLAELATDLDLQPFFSADELTQIIAPESEQQSGEDQSGYLQSQYSILIVCQSEAEQVELLDRLSAEGLLCRSLIS